MTKFSIYLSFTVHYNYTKISRFKPILSITIVSSCFYPPTSHFENFPTWISRLTFAVDAMLNLSINFLPRSQAGVGRWKILETMWSFVIMRVCGFFFTKNVSLVRLKLSDGKVYRNLMGTRSHWTWIEKHCLHTFGFCICWSVDYAKFFICITEQSKFKTSSKSYVGVVSCFRFSFWPQLLWIHLFRFTVGFNNSCCQIYCHQLRQS